MTRLRGKGGSCKSHGTVRSPAFLGDKVRRREWRNKVRSNYGEPWNCIKKFEDCRQLVTDFNQKTDGFPFIKDHFVVWKGTQVFSGILRVFAGVWYLMA